MTNALISTLVLAAFGTAGDFVWANYLPQHRMVAGIIHGALMCMTMGVVLGLPVRRIGAGAIAGLVVGVLAAGSFYALAPLLRMMAMLPAWFALWLLLSVAQESVLWRQRNWGPALLRGVLAGLAAGAAFYAVSGMWTRWNPATINYAEHFGRWLVAFAPGFLVLQGWRPFRLKAAATF